MVQDTSRRGDRPLHNKDFYSQRMPSGLVRYLLRLVSYQALQ